MINLRPDEQPKDSAIRNRAGLALGAFSAANLIYLYVDALSGWRLHAAVSSDQVPVMFIVLVAGLVSGAVWLRLVLRKDGDG